MMLVLTLDGVDPPTLSKLPADRFLAWGVQRKARLLKLTVPTPGVETGIQSEND